MAPQTLGTGKPVASIALSTSLRSRWLIASIPSKPAALADWNFSEMVFPTPLLPHIIPFFIVREGGRTIPGKPGTAATDAMAVAMMVCLVN